MRLPPQHQGLEVKIPSFFRCPISLDVMRSPVSLCTGVTYDRASIQQWLDSGNTTCPATMLPLPSTDLVPNLTLRSLIAHWAASAASCSPTAAGGAGVADSSSARTSSPASLVRQVASSGVDPSPALRELAAYLSDDDVDDFEKNALVGAGRAAETVASVLRRRAEETGVEGVEAATRVLALILASDGIDDSNKKRVATGLAADAAASTASLARVMRGGSDLEARIDAAKLAELLLANAAGEAKAAATKSSELLAELVRLVGTVDETGALDRNAVDAGLSCLAAICGSCRAARGEMVRRGPCRAVRQRGGRHPCGGGQDDEGWARRRGGRRGRALGGLPPVPGPPGGGRGCGGRGRADEAAPPDAERVLAGGETDGAGAAEDIQGERQELSRRLRLQDHPHHAVLRNRSGREWFAAILGGCFDMMKWIQFSESIKSHGTGECVLVPVMFIDFHSPLLFSLDVSR